MLLTRWPWLTAGYGADPDGYRVVEVARQMAGGGAYAASRLPGYPAYEFLIALLANTPAWVSNAVTALFSAAAFALFALILRFFEVRAAALIAAGFAMTPVIYLNSGCTMDYIPALTWMLAATYLTLLGRPLAAGLCLGLAIGNRITSGALALPLCGWFALHCPPRVALRRSLQLAAGAAALATLCFLPVYRRYGPGFFAFYDNPYYPPLDVVARRALPMVWGNLGLLALAAAAAALPLPYLRAALRSPRVRAGLWLAGSSVALYAIAFLRLPDEAGYLIPIVPFVLLGLCLVAPWWIPGAVAIALLGSSFIGLHHDRIALDGPIVEDHAVRESQQRATAAIIQAVAALPGHAVIVSGWVLPRLVLALHGDREGPHQFIYLVENRGEFDQYLASGRQVYYLPGADLYESQAHELELAPLGAHALPVPPELQRPASTGE